MHVVGVRTALFVAVNLLAFLAIDPPRLLLLLLLHGAVAATILLLLLPLPAQSTTSSKTRRRRFADAADAFFSTVLARMRLCVQRTCDATAHQGSIRPHMSFAQTARLRPARRCCLCVCVCASSFVCHVR